MGNGNGVFAFNFINILVNTLRIRIIKHGILEFIKSSFQLQNGTSAKWRQNIVLVFSKLGNERITRRFLFILSSSFKASLAVKFSQIAIYGCGKGRSRFGRCMQKGIPSLALVYINVDDTVL
jgi:hypothetical protein